MDSAYNNQQFTKEYKAVKRRLESGVHPLDINKRSTTVAPNMFLIKTDKGRYIVKHKSGEINVDVLGIADRSNKKNILKFKKLMNKMYGLNLQYTDGT